MNLNWKIVFICKNVTTNEITTVRGLDEFENRINLNLNASDENKFKHFYSHNFQIVNGNNDENKTRNMLKIVQRLESANTSIRWSVTIIFYWITTRKMKPKIT